MKQISFYLDFISPYAYLAFEELPEALKGLSYAVDYKPVLFASMLKHHGHLGPAEIPFKRDWTYRHVLWAAQARGIAMHVPATHPFNPLGLLRLAVALHFEVKGAGENRFPSFGTLTRQIKIAVDQGVANIAQMPAGEGKQAIATKLSKPFTANFGTVTAAFGQIGLGQ